jgi:hypothetical protein
MVTNTCTLTLLRSYNEVAQQQSISGVLAAKLEVPLIDLMRSPPSRLQDLLSAFGNCLC